MIANFDDNLSGCEHQSSSEILRTSGEIESRGSKTSRDRQS